MTSKEIALLDCPAVGNSTVQVPSSRPLTREQILLLNDGSMTLQQAAATFSVDLNKFKAVLEKENILVWNQVDGTKMRIHGGNYEISMIVYFAENMKRYVVKGWYPFEFVIGIIEDGCLLTRGCSKLSYKRFGRDVLIETDRDWHDAVMFFSSNAYVMPLALDVKEIRDAGADTPGSVA